MASQINVNLPSSSTPTAGSVRTNFYHAAVEIEALQADIIALPPPPAGIVGATGTTGATGSGGVRGVTGATGVAGPMGTTGDPGGAGSGGAGVILVNNPRPATAADGTMYVDPDYMDWLWVYIASKGGWVKLI